MSDEAPPNNFYQRDELQCGSAIPTSRPSVSLHVIAVSISLGVMLFITSFCLCSSTVVQAAHGVAKLTKMARDKISSRNDKKNTNARRLKPEARFNLEEVVVATKGLDNVQDKSPIHKHVQNMTVKGQINHEDQNDSDIHVEDPHVVDCHFNAYESDNVKKAPQHPSNQDWNEYCSDSEIEVTSQKTKRKLSRVIRCVDDYPASIEAEKAIKEAALREKNTKRKGSVKTSKSKETKKIEDEIKPMEEDTKSKRRRSKDVEKKSKKDKFSDIDLDEEPGYFELDEPIILEDDEEHLQEKRPSSSGISVEGNKVTRR